MGPANLPPGFRAIDRLDESQVADLHALYQHEWWSRGRTAGDVRRMLAHTDLVFGVAREPSGSLAGFARVLTDRVYKAVVFDVIVAPDCRGLGLGAALMDAVLGHPELRDVRHVELYCLPELMPFYRRWGFSEEVGATRFMRREVRGE